MRLIYTLLISLTIPACAGFQKYGIPAIDCGSQIIGDEVKLYADGALANGTETAVLALRASIPVIRGLTCYLTQIATTRSQSGEIVIRTNEDIIKSRSAVCKGHLRAGLPCDQKGTAALTLVP